MDDSIEKLIILIVGIIAGNGLIVVREIWKEKREVKRNQHASCCMLLPTFDEFILGCENAVRDDGREFGPPPDRYQETPPIVPLPTINIDVDKCRVDALDKHLAYKIMQLPYNLEKSKNQVDFISGEFGTPPDYKEAFNIRRKKFSKLALDAMEVLQEMSKIIEEPLPIRFDEQNKFFQSELRRQIEAEEKGCLTEP